MARDYPDGMLWVDRSPIQKMRYQIFGVQSWENVEIPGDSLKVFTFSIPNDNYTYVIDTIFVAISKVYLMYVWVDFCSDYNNPEWTGAGHTVIEGSGELVLSKGLALGLKYPNAIRIVLQNLSNMSLNGYVYVNYYKFAGV